MFSMLMFAENEKIIPNPGTYLFLMPWWIAPFLSCHMQFSTISSLTFHSLPHSSFMPPPVYFSAFGDNPLSGDATSFLLQVMRRLQFVRFAFHRYYRYFGLVSYFDGDAAGSFGMCYIPSIVFYALL